MVVHTSRFGNHKFQRPKHLGRHKLPTSKHSMHDELPIRRTGGAHHGQRRGLWLAHARELGQRGAKVAINDVAITQDGRPLAEVTAARLTPGVFGP